MYKDEIQKELNLGQMYTAKQVREYILFTDAVVLCDDVSYFNDLDEKSYFVVVDIFESYIHYSQPRREYNVPSEKRKIYKLTRA